MKFNKILCLILAVAMVLSTMSFTAFAEGNNEISVDKVIVITEDTTYENTNFVRAEGYTGAFFSVEGGTLTLKNCTIDAGAKWEVNETALEEAIATVENGGKASNDIKDIITINNGNVITSEHLITVNGTANLNLENTVIENMYSESNVSAVYVASSEKNEITLEDAVIRNIAAPKSAKAFSDYTQGEDIVTFKGATKFCNNIGTDPGAIIVVGGGVLDTENRTHIGGATLYIEGENVEICNNIGVDGSIMMVRRGDLYMNGGKIYNNYCLFTGNNFSLSPLYVYDGVKYEMTDGEISGNYGYRSNALILREHSNAELNGGSIGAGVESNNVNSSAFINSPMTIGEEMTIDGNLLSSNIAPVENNGIIDGNVTAFADVENSGTVTGNIQTTAAVTNTETGVIEGDVKVVGTNVSFVNNGTLNGDIINDNNENVVAFVEGTAYTTLQAAISAAKADDTVTILAGTYEMPTISKKIKIVGIGDVTITNQVQVKINTVEMENIDFVNPNGNCLRECYANGEVKFTDCSFIAQTYAVHFGGGSGSVTFDNCEFSGWTSFASTVSKVTFNDCTFRQDEISDYNYVRVYQDADLTGCEFDGTTVGMAKKTATLNVNGCYTTDGSDLLDVFEDAKVEYGTIYIDNNLVGRAKIGNTSYNTFADALEATKNMPGDVIIDLYADVELSYGAREAYGAADTDSITINGNDYTLKLKQTDSDWSSIGMANADGVFKMNNVKVVKTGYGVPTGAWNTHAINFNVNVEFTNVDFDNSIKVGGATSTLTNVNIVEDEEYYGIWIPADAQTVTINGGSITATNGGRGIKIADEYIATPAKVNLNVTGMTFETAKKAAVLVSSTAGAAITASDNDITKVAADSVNFAWVDEDWESYASEVTVNGKPVVVESEVATTISVSFDKVSDGLYNIVLTGHNGDIYEFVAAEFTFKNESTTVGGSEMKYEILGYTENNVVKTVVEQAATDGKEAQYIIRIPDGAETSRLSGAEFVVGQVKFIGQATTQFQGNIKFSVIGGEVDTTKEGTHLGKYYTVDDEKAKLVLGADAAIDSTISEIKRDVEVNVKFNHDIDGSGWENDEFKVTLKHNFATWEKDLVINDAKMNTVVFDDIPLGQISVTLTAPGFRTYTYKTVVEENADLVLNFWNDVKRENKEVIETGKNDMYHNFLVGDIVMDYTVDKYDLAAVTSYYGTYEIAQADAEKYLKYDLNRDGDIDIRDVQYVLHTMGN